LHTLDAHASVVARASSSDVVLALSMPRASPGFDTTQMAYQRQPHQIEYFALNRWLDTPAHMLEPLLLQSLEQSRGFSAVVRTPGLVTAKIRLDTELIRLQQDFTSKPSRIQLTLRAQLVDISAKRVLAVKVFDVVENAASDDAQGGVAAANLALKSALDQVLDFCLKAPANF
jgi:cholesterol transport system auxiliary component